jgi:hypothetical protein
MDNVQKHNTCIIPHLLGENYFYGTVSNLDYIASYDLMILYNNLRSMWKDVVVA